MSDLIFLVWPEHLLLYLFAYGLAAVPTSYLVARFIHGQNLKDQKAQGHTATYVFTHLSKWSGVLVFFCDFMKGLLPVAIGFSLQSPIEVLALIGFFAVLGHCFSIWLRLLGGHGGATSAGAMFVIYWPSAFAVAIFNSLLIVFGLNAGLASVAAVVAGLIVVFFGLANKVVLLIVAAMAALVVVRHWSELNK